MEIQYVEGKLSQKLDSKQLVKDIYAGVSVKYRPLPCSICEAARVNKTAPMLHFHGSQIGHCAKQIQHSALSMLQGIAEGGFTDSKLFTFNDGHVHEATILDSLENCGHVITDRNVEHQKWYYDKDTKEDILVVGHPDGVLNQYGNKYILECKAVKEYAYNKYAKGVMTLWYYGQVQIYADMLDAVGGVLLVKNRNTSLVNPYVLDRNKQFISVQIKILGQIQAAIRAKVILEKPYENKEGECFWCPLKGSCWE